MFADVKTMTTILSEQFKTDKKSPVQDFINGQTPNSGKKMPIGRIGFTATRYAKKRFCSRAVWILFLSLFVFLPFIPSELFRTAWLSLHCLILVGIILFGIKDQKSIQRRFLESETIAARTAVTADSTGGNSKTATNRSPEPSSFSGCDHP
jgi:hypothetical protein